MLPANVIICILAYILGLFVSAIPGALSGTLPGLLGLIPVGGLGLLLMGGVAAIVMPRIWRTGPRSKIWLVAGFFGLFATVYLQIRTPQPGPQDISRLIMDSRNTPTSLTSKQVIVQGQVDSVPRLNRSQRVQFWLQVKQARDVVDESVESIGDASIGDASIGDASIGDASIVEVNQPVSGRLYVTVPLLQGTGIYPGQTVEVSGTLYVPGEATNPGAFDFRAYLARQGGFAGLSAHMVQNLETAGNWGWWQLRRRIVKAHVSALGSPAGPLVSAMVMGSRTVDLPHDVRDKFARIGLSHTIAASGFHVSLVLWFALVLVKNRSPRIQFAVGTGALLLFVSLTGLHASIMRATLMGMGALTALVMQRKVKPLGALLFAAFLLLIFQPLWIWDLGFQLSFLATFGLLTTVPPILTRLDWVPPRFAPLIAVPIAASIWTIPLQLYTFGVFSPYSVLVNIITTPLIVVMSLGGIFTGMLAFLSPFVSMVFTWVLKYPTDLLLAIVDSCIQLPGAAIAVGKASLVQVTLLYGLMLLVWVRSGFGRYWSAIAGVMLGIIFIPGWIAQANLSRLTIVSGAEMPTMIVEDKGTVGLVNSGGETTAHYTVLPFLQQHGINQLDWVLSTENSPENRQGWLRILQQMPIAEFYDASLIQKGEHGISENDTFDQYNRETIQSALNVNHGDYVSVTFGTELHKQAARFHPLTDDLRIWHCQWYETNWLWMFGADPQQQAQLAQSIQQKPTNIVVPINRPAPSDFGNSLLWWSGNALAEDLLSMMQPPVAIASSRYINDKTLGALAEQGIKVYWTGRDGALQWHPTQGISATLDIVQGGEPG